MASLVLKPVIRNLDLVSDLMAVPTSPRNVILINQFGIFWAAPMRSSVLWALSILHPLRHHQEAICVIKTPASSPPPQMSWPQITFSFPLANDFLALPTFLEKPSILYHSPGQLFHDPGISFKKKY